MSISVFGVYPVCYTHPRRLCEPPSVCSSRFENVMLTPLQPNEVLHRTQVREQTTLPGRFVHR